jgi:hypothetical protein
MTCKTCADTRWVCEEHPRRPWGSGHPNACQCGGAGMPCPDCNEPKAGERPVLPADFTPTFDSNKGPIH